MACRAALLAALLARETRAQANCGSFTCPTGFEGRLQAPSSITCANNVCTTDICCTQSQCSTSDSSAAILVNNANSLLPTLSSCNTVGSAGCALTCKSGFGNGSPVLSCVSSGSGGVWQVSGSCATLVCPSTYPCTSPQMVCGLDVSSCNTFFTSPCPAASGFSCKPGYSGSATLTCGADGAWTTSGTCTEAACTNWAVPVGVEAGLTDPCTISGGVVPQLNPVTSPTACRLRCKSGYITTGSGVLSCLITGSTAAFSTTLNCTEQVCGPYTLPTGVAATASSGCTVVDGVVPGGTLTAVTAPSCGIECAAGYNTDTEYPTASPTTLAPSASPTKAPTISPTGSPTRAPTRSPTHAPTTATNWPSNPPTKVPTASPTSAPTWSPTASPTRKPSTSPTGSPTMSPTVIKQLTCNAGSLTPTAALRCVPFACSTLSVTYVLDSSGAQSASVAFPPNPIYSGALVEVSYTASTAWVKPTNAGYTCNVTHGQAVCLSDGAAAEINGMLCTPKVCEDVTTATGKAFFAGANAVAPTAQSDVASCDTVPETAGCSVTCAQGYAAGTACTTKLLCSDPTPNDASPGGVGAWALETPCTPIACSVADLLISTTNPYNLRTLTQADLIGCDEVRESGTPCTARCADGYASGATGRGPQIVCKQTSCAGVWSVTEHCVAMCAPPSVPSGATLLSNTASSCTATACTGDDIATQHATVTRATCAVLPTAAGTGTATPTGWFLHPQAQSTRCNAPSGTFPADPATDCTVQQCCRISCGMYTACGTGFTTKATPAAHACAGPLLSDCSDALCCDQVLCNTVNAPTSTQATVNCNSATAHGAECLVTADAGYVCSGKVTCTAGTAPSYLTTPAAGATTLCTIAQCPENSGSPPSCNCNAGYAGTAQWSGTQWTHSCIPEQCARTSVANSRDFSGSLSLSGTTGTTVAVVCLTGYSLSSATGTTTCRGATLQFDVVTCDAQNCTPRQFPNSQYAATGSVVGKTGESRTVTCDKGYVGTGTGCPSACTTTCDGSTFSAVECTAAECPLNSGPKGTCACNAGYAVAASGSPTWNTALGRWTHVCLATCGTYTCQQAGLTGLQPPDSFLCPNTSASSCADSLCCRGAMVVPTTGLVTTEGGGQATFTVALVSRPKAAVSVQYTSSDTTEGRVSVSTLVFDSNNWNVLQTVTVVGQDDAVADGDQTYYVRSSLSISTDSNYNGRSFPQVTLTNTDDDTSGVLVSPISGLVTTEAGGSDTFTVVLRSEPTSDVTIPVGIPANQASEGTLSATSLLFTTGNWNTAQTVTVTGVADNVDDGNVAYVIDLGPTTSSDKAYDQVSPSDVQVTNMDDDTTGIIVTPTSGLQTTEGGGQATFTIRLNSRPTQTVSIPLRSSNTAEGAVSPTVVQIAPAAWQTAQTVTVTGVNDNIDDDDIAYTIILDAASSSDGNYNGLDPNDVSVVNIDDDSRGATVTPTSGLVTTELGRSTRFIMVLDTQPTATVMFTFTGDATEGVLSPSNVYFSAANYSTQQTVTVTGLNDNIADGPITYTILGRASSADAKYNGYSAPAITVTNEDDDVAGIKVSPTAGLVTTEKGGRANFTMRLTSEPVAGVTIALSTDPSEGALTPTLLSFNSANWDTLQTVTIEGVNDWLDDGDVIYSVVPAPAISADGVYKGINASTVSVTNIDDDTRGVSVDPTFGLVTTEQGGTAQYTVVLDSEPRATVTIATASSDATEGLASPDTLTFTPTTWNLKQTVVVTGQQDTLQDGPVPYHIVNRAAVSADSSYSNFDPADVYLTNLDDDTPGVTVAPRAGLITSESGTSAVFTVALESVPTAVVQMTMTGDTTEGVLSPGSLSFQPSNWNIPQTVTVVGVDDVIQDGNQTYDVVIQPAVSADPNYNGLKAFDVQVTNLDNDVAGITVSPISGLRTSEGGQTATFTAVLQTQPIAGVSLTLAGDSTEGIISPQIVRFTSANWNVVQTVTVTGRDDDEVDGDVAYTIQVLPSSGGDPNYAGIRVSSVSVINADNDTVGFAVWPTSGLVTTEAGGSATCTWRLRSRPVSDVRIALQSSDLSEGTVNPSALVFSPVVWNVPQTVTVTGVNDEVDDGNQTYQIVSSPAVSTDPMYNGQDPPDVTVINADDDVAGVIVAPTSGLVTSEAGATAAFTVRLASEPAANVGIGITSGDASEGTVAPTALTFTAANWRAPQTVTVTGADDRVADGNVTYTISTNPAQSADARYDGLNPDNVQVVNMDNDVAGITVAPTTGLYTNESGGTALFTVVLRTEPTASLSIGVTTNDSTEGTASPGTLTFTSGDWETPKTVTVTGVDDVLDDGDVPFNVTFSSVVTTDRAYAGMRLQPITVTNRDNDVPGVWVSPTSGLVTTEQGGAAEFAVRLNTQPAAAVTVGIASSDITEGRVSIANLVFTVAGWNREQTVTVTGVDDAVADGDIAYSITTNPASSADPKYDKSDPPDVSVTNLDDDTADVLINPTAGLVTTERGQVATFTIALASEPTAGVSIGISSSDITEGTVSPASVSFATADWNILQTVTVTGVDDNVMDGDITFTVATSAATSSDNKYDGFNAGDVTVVNRDDDRAGLNITPSTGLVTSEAGGKATFTVVLSSEPTSDVTLPVSSSDTTEGVVSVSSLVFVPALYSRPQTVTVSGVDDDVADGNVVFSIRLGPASSVDVNYNGMDPPDPGATNVDNDTAAVIVSPLTGLSTAERGTTATFTVRLGSRPSADVTCHIRSQDRSEGEVTPSVVSWSTTSWNIPTTITVIGVDDWVDDGDVTYTIALQPTISRDSTYNGVNPPDVLVTNIDDDTRGVIVSPTAGLVVNEQGRAANFSIKLNSEPTAGVFVRFASSNTREGTVSPPSVLFTAANWNWTHNVTVRGVADAVSDGDVQFTITGGPTASSDPLYAGLSVPDVGAVNTDVLDECQTSAGTVCISAGQRCRDPDVAPGSVNDWQCECTGNSTGSARGGVAVCAFIGECGANAATCTAAGQTCVDPTAAAGDWQCACVWPQTGAPATGRPTTACQLDECTGLGLLCRADRQTCVDTDLSPASTGDWECRCPSPMVGTAVGRLAVCTFKGECVQRAAACTAVGQTCDDPNVQRSGDWECVCLSPAVGRRTGAPANCAIDECTLHGEVCTSSGQQCVDPDTAALSRDDWRCNCVGSRESGTASAMPAACTLDECEQFGATCSSAGQLCEDQNTHPSATGDWECVCVPPAVGRQRSGRAVCAFSGECSVHSAVCVAAGQTCYDPDEGTADDWECQCVPPNDLTTRRGAPAACILDDCKANGTQCSSAGQTCRDPNKDTRSTGDFVCDCVPPAVGSAVGRAALCVFQGECALNAHTCVSRGQSCRDPDLTQEGDWECFCLAPETGSAVGRSAACQLDECTVHAGSCSRVGQTCSDPNTSPSSTGDWICSCVPPATGSARAQAAVCVFQGECGAFAQTCTAAGQTCADPNTATVGDWTCFCVTPAVGSATAAVASCVLDECGLAAGQVCERAGQRCHDPVKTPASTRDWVCECTGGLSRGSAQGVAAKCVLDECLGPGTVCATVGQVCEDRNTDPANTGDWRCICPPPAVGQATARQATCTFRGECAAQSTVCTSRGQTCVDPDETRTGDWQCRCVAPEAGAGTAGAAACKLDECIQHGMQCARRGQVCADPNTDPSSVGDWVCSCSGSATGSTTAGPASCAHFGECAVHAATCTAAGQACSDPDDRRTGDWQCLCVEPYTGRATAKLATCIFDECTVSAAVCTTAGQKCRDPNPSPSSTGDWQCSCVGSSATGTAVAGPAKCILDECAAKRDVCAAAGQLCNDRNTDPASLGDWACVCVPPASGTARGTRAACAHVGECVANARICTAVGQACVDWDTTRQGDWRCSCLPPLHGSATGKPATCLIDECREAGDAVCRAAGQLCQDPDTRPGSLGDWTCNCVPPATGSQTGRAAACRWGGECAAHAAVCTSVGQTCRDPNAAVTGDWQCVCVAPEQGVRTGGAVPKCSLDECALHGDECRAVGQTCVDPTREAAVTGDWHCSCVPPATGSAIGRAAACTFQGECIIQAGVCTTVGQTCVDPDPRRADDWECVCLEPQAGRARGLQAQCILDECLLHGSLCTNSAQRCSDPNTSPASTGDWICECIGSATGSAPAAPAACAFSGACAGAGGRVCTAAGQACLVPELARQGEFQCVCVPPLSGRSTLSPATCTVNECTLHGARCSASGQTCSDPDPSPGARGDWICSCVPPARGSAVGAPASCVFPGECAVHAGTCTAAGQTCVDPDLSKAGDWQCACVAPAIGTASGQPATCELDECVANGVTCTSSGQTCHDPTPVSAATDDWVCMCAGSQATGASRAKAAPCRLDECLDSGRVCRQAGQTCSDPNTDPVSLGDWRCTCAGSSAGTAVGQAATCAMQGECASSGSVCASVGQACSDPDESITGDWQCVCVEPQTGTAATASTASCRLDECTLYAAACTDLGQTCRDPDTDTSATGDWVCECSSPLTGAATAQAATCAFVGECVSTAITCTAAGQTCMDGDLSRQGDWQCVCIPPQTGSPATARAAACVLDECLINGHVCRQEGQLCEDPNTSPASPGDWYCACIAPATGTARAAAAKCSFAGECTVNAHTCTNAGMTCVDPTASVGDWQCVCVPPATGQATASPTPCVLDECAGNGDTCRLAGQLCVDPTPTPNATADWRCECVSPAVGSAVGGAATCQWTGECVDKYEVCTKAGQTCEDPTANAGDWQCACLAPRTGRATGRVAACALDECQFEGGACAAAGQLCSDRHPAETSLGDWTCDCMEPAVGSRIGGVATCTFDECSSNRAACESAGQRCEDPDVAKGGDWRCVCVPPQSGSELGGAATCVLDECITLGSACRVVGQMCSDPNTGLSSIGDWTCNCVGSATGSAAARPASCTYSGECVANARTCTAAGQACREPDAQRRGDWECECVSPLRGSATATVAACVLDECVTLGAVCTALGQTCRDPNTDPQQTGDWYCACPAPSAGQAVARPAACSQDECMESGMVCLSLGQTCHDPNTDPASTGDWTCSCVGSARGTAVAKIAACVNLGECAANALTCAASGQACRDPDPAVQGDWRCECVPPSAGRSVTRGVATCLYDECALAGRQCLAVGQTCNDPNQSPTATGDWVCSCGGSASGVATARPAECIHTGECGANARVCADSGQQCRDLNPSLRDDWECVCVPPAVGRNRNAPAQCVLDECLQHGAICTTARQRCVDSNTHPLSVGDWRCVCEGSFGVGSRQAGQAACVLDECLTAGRVCVAAGQECVDLNTSPESTGDWECRCVGSSTGQAALTPAACTHSGECAQQARACTNAGQACVDPDASRPGDWQCVCISPRIGRATAAAATCVLDECVTNWGVCSAAGQTCKDPNTSPTSTGDWSCECVVPATGSARGSATTCAFAGECALHSALCTSSGQSCEDPDLRRTGDWRCVCVPPQSGPSATAGQASCLLDECEVAGQACRSVGQTCTDPNRDPASTGDWRCDCVAPAAGAAQGQAALCQYQGECASGPGAACAAAAQGCSDPTPSDTAGDWECICVPPAVGRATAKAAECVLDECSLNGHVCSAAGQACVDPNTAAASAGDWRCDCANGRGSATARPAVCLVDECAATGRAACAAAGQSCADPNMAPAASGDWRCSCVGSGTGSARAAPAGCNQADECSENANAQRCTQAGQACFDPDARISGNWLCVCPPPQTGSRLGTSAQCTLDECWANRAICFAAGQVCRDPNTLASSLGDWLCECSGSAQGSAVGRPASCTYTGECVGNAQVCAAAWQECRDPSSSADDWQCACVSPAAGDPALGRPTVCALDECALHAQVCTSAGQLCRDPDTRADRLGDWTCTCQGSGTGSARATVAACTHTGECAIQAGYCAAAGQACRDPSASVTGDWRCECITPRTGSATGSRALCAASGECAQFGSVCTANGQTCVDPDPNLSNDWQCRCVPPQQGSATGRAAQCSQTPAFTPAPPGLPVVVVSTFVAGKTASQMRAERAAFVAAAQRALRLADTPPKTWTFSLQSQISRAAFSEANALSAVVTAINSAAPPGTPEIQVSDLILSSWQWRDGAQGRRGSTLQVTADATFELVGGSDTDRAAWQQELASKESALTNSAALRAVPGSLAVTTTAPQVGFVPALTAIDFVDTDGGAVALMRVEQAGSDAATLQSTVGSFAAQSSATFAAAGFTTSTPATATSDCSALICGTGQTCSDSGGPDGNYRCTCNSGAGVGINERATCVVARPPPPPPPPSPPPSTPSPAGTLRPPPPPTTAQPTSSISAAAESDDSVIGMSKGAGIAVIIVVVIAVLALFVLLFKLTRKPAEPFQPQMPPGMGSPGSDVGPGKAVTPDPDAGGRVPALPHSEEPSQPVMVSPLEGRDPEGLPHSASTAARIGSPQTDTRLPHHARLETPPLAGGGDISPPLHPQHIATLPDTDFGDPGVRPDFSLAPRHSGRGGLTPPQLSASASGRRGSGWV